MRFRPGQQLQHNQYTVERALARGGMGEVYLVTEQHQMLKDRTWVMKVMHDYFDPTQPQSRQAAQIRSRQETNMLAALHHTGIPAVKEYFEDGQDTCIVMEYIDGHDLEAKLTHRDVHGHTVHGHAYPYAVVLRWGIEICHILEYLGSCTPPVVHQDIKPANLLLRHDGTIYLIDFGTACTHIAQPTQAQLQQPSLYGTHGYAPPEQHAGQTEPRTDVYALAATLYHLATDDHPCDPFMFPRLQQLRALGQVLQLALHNEVDQRPHAAAFRQHLEQQLHEIQGASTSNRV